MSSSMSSAPSLPHARCPAPASSPSRPTCPARAARPGHAKVHKLSSNETPLGPSPKAVAAMRAEAAKLELYPDGTARACCARRSPRATASTRPRIVCGAGSDELLSFLAYAYLGAGDEGIFTEHGFLVYRIAILAAGGTPVVVPERDLTRRCRRAARRRHAAHEDRLPRQPQQPDRHLPALRRGAAPACGPAAPRPPRPRRGLRRIRAARTTTAPASNSCCEADNVVMTRTFSKIHGLAALRHRLDGRPGRGGRRGQPHPRALQLSGAGIAAGAAAIADDAHVAAAVAHNDAWLAALTRAVAGARPHRDAERRQLHPRPLPRRAGPDGRRGRRVPLRAGASSSGGSRPTACRTPCA